jgi:CheY-like chemotaxis protein
MTAEETSYLAFCRNLRQQLRSGGSVLVVEDDLDTARLIMNIVKYQGLPTEAVTNVEDAMTYIQEHSEEIQCVVIDLHLGSSDGEEIIQFIETQHSRVPYLVYTSDYAACAVIEKKYPRATIVRKGDSINGLIKGIGVDDGSYCTVS